MPSPFPGMDPFIEMFEWEDFHTTAIGVMRELLAPQVAETYMVRVERRVYLEHDLGDDETRVADVAIVDGATANTVGTPVSPTTAAQTVEYILPMPEEHREAYLLIKEKSSKEVVTVIELLSPGNKRRGSDGHREYLDKRESTLRTRANLIEIDLLRAGERLPMRTPLPPGDYYAVVSRRKKRPTADVVAWFLRDTLPNLAIPLRPNDVDVTLELQKVHDTTYDRALYGNAFDYSETLKPPLTEEQDDWLKQTLSKK